MFLLFAYDGAGNGGWEDYRSSYPSAVEAKAAAERLLAAGKFTNAHVVSLHSMEIITELWSDVADCLIHTSVSEAILN